mmetsp:Transcript_17680/g.40562  ORF Transcript_17680/g.40562 Transcript_17680/m.40562 type:complete len:245 (-) Transcript_17680:264-998(-)
MRRSSPPPPPPPWGAGETTQRLPIRCRAGSQQLLGCHVRPAVFSVVPDRILFPLCKRQCAPGSRRADGWRQRRRWSAESGGDSSDCRCHCFGANHHGHCHLGRRPAHPDWSWPQAPLYGRPPLVAPAVRPHHLLEERRGNLPAIDADPGRPGRGIRWIGPPLFGRRHYLWNGSVQRGDGTDRLVFWAGRHAVEFSRPARRRTVWVRGQPVGVAGSVGDSHCDLWGFHARDARMPGSYNDHHCHE